MGGHAGEVASSMVLEAVQILPDTSSRFLLPPLLVKQSSLTGKMLAQANAEVLNAGLAHAYSGMGTT